jgi:hypothetical protein
VGPRVISLSLAGGENLFADLPDFTIDCPGVGPYHIYGGHRLWHAPEDPRRTYIPDDNPVEIIPIGDSLHIKQRPEAQTGIQKSLKIRLLDDSPWVVLDHQLANTGLLDLEAAVWAITQFNPGGVAILPQFSETSDSGGFLPNRSVALWQYTDIRSPHIAWGNRYIFVDANTPKPLKIGFPNPREWLAYYRSQTLFVKYAQYDPNVEYYDHGSSSECYSGPDFLELETLGPRMVIQSGETVAHREVWRVIEDVPFAPNEDRMDEIVRNFDLEREEAEAFLLID